jgi:hypothetical protein
MRLRSPEYWRARAEEARAVVESTRSIEGRNAMLEIAAQYEVLARSSESFAKNVPNVEWKDEPPEDRRAEVRGRT